MPVALQQQQTTALDVTGDDSENSVFGSLTALGGGRGRAYSASTEVRRHGTDGGSGGGGSNGNDVAGDNFGLELLDKATVAK